MSNLYKTFKTNKNLETDGVTVNYGTNSNGEKIEFLIARAGGSNTKFARLLEAKMKPYRRQIQTDTMDPKVAKQLTLEVFAKTIILGFSGVEDENGVALPYSYENVIKLMTDLPDLYADLQAMSQEISVFREAVIQEDVKN